MKNYICLFILISFVSGPAIGDDTKPKSEKPMTAKDLFAKSSPAVVRIITFDGNGKEKSLNPSPPVHRRTVTRNQISYQ